MEFKKINKSRWCCICDNAMADYEITNNGSLRPFWCLPSDGEICICKSCAKNFFDKMKKVLDKDMIL